MQKVVNSLTALQRQRRNVMKDQMRHENKGKAVIRHYLGWRWEMKDTPEGDKIIKQSQDIYKQVKDDGHSPDLEDAEGKDVLVLVLLHQSTAKQFEKHTEALGYKISTVVKKGLPKVAAWVERNHGVGHVTIGGIIGECGNLSERGGDDYQGYATVSRVWRRMCMGVIDGKAQGKPGEIVNGKRVASREEWEEHGPNKQCRSLMWSVSKGLVNAGARCPYRLMYEELKAMYVDRGQPLWLAALNSERRIAKRLLADLWEVWNDHKTSQRVAA